MRKSIHDYKMIYLDAGDTLLELPGAERILREYLAGRSLERDEARIGELFSEAFRLFYYERKPDIFEACTPESDRAFWAGLYAFVLRKLDAHEALSEDEMHKSCHELYDIYTAPEQYALFADVEEALQRLRAMNMKVGIVSNFAPTLRTILASKGILHYFDPVIVSTEVGLEKPDPAIFKLALEQAGLPPEDVLYVGDHDTNDIWAPAQVGIEAVKIIRYTSHSGPGIRSLLELFA